MYILYHNNIYKGVYPYVYMENKQAELKKKIADRIKKLLQEIEGLMKGMNIPDKVMEKEVTLFGNSAHIVVPRQYIKKKAIIIMKK